MDISNTVALVTGANRGLGREFARQLLERGAATVYAAARRPDSVDLSGVVPLRLDITDPDAVRDAASEAPDITLLINNAGIATTTNLVTGDLERIRDELDVHFWGTLGMTRAFAPILGANGGGAIINVMSLLSFRVYPGNGAYAAAKAAEWALTDSTRLELAAQGTQVLGAHLSSTDTDMMAGWDIPKASPAEAVRGILDALEADASEYLDAETAQAKAELPLEPNARYAGLVGRTVPVGGRRDG